MENDLVVVEALVHQVLEVLHHLRDLLGVQQNGDVAHGGLHDGDVLALLGLFQLDVFDGAGVELLPQPVNSGMHRAQAARSAAAFFNAFIMRINLSESNISGRPKRSNLLHYIQCRRNFQGKNRKFTICKNKTGSRRSDRRNVSLGLSTIQGVPRIFL